MPRVAIVSDTHVPSRASEIPEWVVDEIHRADHTVHAGDFDSPDAYETVRELAGGALTAVRGNVDPGALDLPATATVEIGGVTFVVTHGTGSPRGWSDRVAATVREEADPNTDANAVGVAGHTHRVVDRETDGVRLLNPGSATGAAPASRTTMMSVAVENGSLDVTVLEDGG